MDKKPEQNYHHGNLRAQLLDTAVKHLREQGVEKLSLRAIAREIGVSQTAPYRHFEDKSALLAALAAAGFEMLTREMMEAIKPHKNNAGRALQASGTAYINFARRNPEKYQLMFGQRIIDVQQYPELAAHSKESFQVLVDIIEQGIKEKTFKKQPVEMVANTAWALVHGLATLINDRLQWTMSEKAIAKQIELSTHILIERF